MTFSLKEKELLKKALHLYVMETAGQYDFVSSLDITFSPEFEEKMERLIKRRRKPFYYLFNTAAKRVACIIAALIIAMVSTVLSVDALRNGVKNFFVEVYEKFSTVLFEKDSSSPDTIEVYYSPSYIPDGYQLSEITKEASLGRIKFIDENGKEIIYTQSFVFSSGTDTNTEDGHTEEIGNGFYIYQDKFQQKMYFWSDTKYQFAIYAYDDISKDELLKMAGSLQPEH